MVTDGGYFQLLTQITLPTAHVGVLSKGHF